MSEIGTAVIGYGYAGRAFHSYLVGLTDGLALKGIASRSAETREKIKAERGCRAYAGLEEALADDDVELVVIASPSHVHAEQAIAALNAGKHVVTDKPMAMTLNEAEMMIAQAERQGRMLSVFHNRRWDGDYLTVKQLVDRGELEVRRIETAWSRFGMPRGWRGERDKAGGRLYDLGSHMIDQIQLLCPRPITSVYARLQYDSDERDVESDAIVVIGFEDGATAIVEASSISAIEKPRWYVTGSKGTFLKHGLDPQEAAMKAGDIDAAVEPAETYGRLHDGERERVVPTVPGRWRSFYENIAAHLRDGAPLAVTPQSVRRTMAAIDAAFESHEKGTSIDRRIE